MKHISSLECMHLLRVAFDGRGARKFTNLENPFIFREHGMEKGLFAVRKTEADPWVLSGFLGVGHPYYRLMAEDALTEPPPFWDEYRNAAIGKNTSLMDQLLLCQLTGHVLETMPRPTWYGLMRRELSYAINK